MGFTVKATLSVKAGLARRHLISADLFRQKCDEITTSEIGLVWPQPRWDESQSYANAAVMLSVAALEAAINEFYLEAQDKAHIGIGDVTPDKCVVMSEAWDEIDQFSILKKYELAIAFCGRQKLARGNEPYQSATTLIDLRNALVHFKPEWDHSLDRHLRLEERIGGKFKDCALSLRAEGKMLWFPHRCMGLGCAKWSVDSARDFANHFAKSMGIPPRFPNVK